MILFTKNMVMWTFVKHINVVQNVFVSIETKTFLPMRIEIWGWSDGLEY